MGASRAAIVDAVERQARSCDLLGSPIYAALLTEIAADIRAGGPCASVLEGVSERPVHDAIPLRLLATTHRLALAGSAPSLAERYPSCGGSWAGEPLLPALHATMSAHPAEITAGLLRNVQTNETGRMPAIVAGCSHVAERTGMPLRTWEVGASAGLLSLWPHARVETGATATGAPDSPLRFDASWFEAPLPRLLAHIDVVEAAASDVAPIDVTSPAGRITAASFVWPDQTARRDRLLAACDLAVLHGLHVERADAGTWLARRLAAPLPDGVATVVFHSIVWQYLPPATRDALRDALRDAGQGTTEHAPLCWLRMEPATAEHADLRLTTWPSGTEEVLAHVGYHGTGVRSLTG